MGRLITPCWPCHGGLLATLRPGWASSAASEAAPGAWQVADQLSELKLGNGTSILITANIASALPTSVGAALQSAATRDQSNLAIYAAALFATTLGVVYVQVRPPPAAVLHCCTSTREGPGDTRSRHALRLRQALCALLSSRIHVLARRQEPPIGSVCTRLHLLNAVIWLRLVDMAMLTTP